MHAYYTTKLVLNHHPPPYSDFKANIFCLAHKAQQFDFYTSRFTSTQANHVSNKQKNKPRTILRVLRAQQNSISCTTTAARRICAKFTHFSQNIPAPNIISEAGKFYTTNF